MCLSPDSPRRSWEKLWDDVLMKPTESEFQTLQNRLEACKTDEGKELGPLEGHVRDEKLKDAVDQLRKDKNYELKNNTVILTPNMIPAIEGIADYFYSKTKKKIVITDGVRTPLAHAKALYTKLQKGDDLFKLYSWRIHKELKAVVKAYNDNLSKGRDTTLSEMAKEIKAAADKGVYLTKHLRANAFDIRDKDLSPAQKKILKEAIAKNSNLKLIIEKVPPHHHVQMINVSSDGDT